MKRLVLYILVSLFCTVLLAQQKLSFSVLEFEQDVFDTSAKSTEYGKKDGNGSWYAIIKVTSNNPDDDITACQFNFGNMSSKVEKHGEALWVYVQRNAKKVTISRSGYHTISQYDLKTTIEAGANYKMVLTSDRVQQQAMYDVKKQMVIFQMTPAIAGLTVMIKRQDSDAQSEVFGTTDKNGEVAKDIDFGRYTYRVMSADKMFQESEGVMNINNSDETFVEKVVLKPNFANMTFIAGDDIEIFIDKESKGIGGWSGRLAPGEYIITCKKANHRDSQKRITVKEGDKETINLLPPTPITGSLTVNTSPLGAAIKIDGKEYGKSPRIIKDVLIGEHQVELSLQDHKTVNRNVIILENEMYSLKLTMEGTASNRLERAQRTYCESCGKLTSVCEYGGNHGLAGGHEWIDLGLSSGTCWANENLGARTDIIRGNFFQWGSTNMNGVKSDYQERFPANPGSGSSVTCVPTYLDSQHDAATMNWGAEWRIPTCAEYQELLDECKWEWTKSGNSVGYKVTGPNGLGIFFPAGGLSTVGVINQDVCYYGTSQSGDLGYTDNLQGNRAYAVMFSKEKRLFWDIGLDAGCLVRPVTNGKPIAEQKESNILFKERGNRDVTLLELFTYPFGDKNGVLLNSVNVVKLKKYADEKKIDYTGNYAIEWNNNYQEFPVFFRLEGEDCVTYHGLPVTGLEFSYNANSKQMPPKRHIYYYIDLNPEKKNISDEESVSLFKSIIQEANMVWSSNSWDVSGERLSNENEKYLLLYEIKSDAKWINFYLNKNKTVTLEIGLAK